MQTILLTQRHVAELIDRTGRDVFMDLMIERLEHAFVAAGCAGTVVPLRGGFVRGLDGVIEWMPFHDEGRAMTLKTVAYTPTNPARHGLPTIAAAVTRFDDETGRLLAICEGGTLTAVRTGAASAIASRLLAHPDSRCLGLVGAGAQALTQAHALHRVFKLDRVLVYDINEAHARSFPHRAAFLNCEVLAAPLADLVAAADIICTATSVEVGHGPVLPAAELCPHVHINAVGSDLVGKVELPLAVLRSALVVPDHAAQARREGECQQLDETEIGPEVTTLCGMPDGAVPFRDRPTVFDSTGIALEDHVAVDVLLELAADTGIGDRIALDGLAADPLDPYAHVRDASRAGDRGLRRLRTPSRVVRRGGR